jgi:hypothetical protein
MTTYTEFPDLYCTKGDCPTAPRSNYQSGKVYWPCCKSQKKEPDHHEEISKKSGRKSQGKSKKQECVGVEELAEKLKTSLSIKNGSEFLNIFVKNFKLKGRFELNQWLLSLILWHKQNKMFISNFTAPLVKLAWIWRQK